MIGTHFLYVTRVKVIIAIICVLAPICVFEIIIIHVFGLRFLFATLTLIHALCSGDFIHWLAAGTGLGFFLNL